MIQKKTWAEFRSTGLAVFVNQFLHLFGWAIAWEEEDGQVVNCYPVRCKFRGFDEKTTDDAYQKAAAYMRDHGKELYDEADFNQ